MIETNFKHTDIGLIPHDWEVKELEPLCSKLCVGFVGTCEPYYVSAGRGVKMVRTGDLKDSYVDLSNTKFISYDFHRSHLKSQLKRGDILIARHGSNGHGVIYDSDAEANSLNIVILRTESISNKYIIYLLDSPSLRLQIEGVTAGSTQRVINTKEIAKLQIPLPPTLDEQEKIANALSKIDQLINDLGALIEKKKAIKQGTMQDLLTAKRRLKGFTGEWNSVKLGDLLEYRQPTKYLVSSKEYTTQGVPVLTAGKTFILGYTQENWGLYDDLPVIIFDDFVVESKYVTMPFKVKSSAIKMLSLREKENDLRFIFEKMQCIEFPIADHKRHWISEYSQLEITIPEPNEQRAIANILSSMDTEITNLEQKRDKYIAIKQGMMQNLLTGKIRLI